jgi:hypothetical protein
VVVLLVIGLLVSLRVVARVTPGEGRTGPPGEDTPAARSRKN